jgi:hypothetical protein
MAGDTVARPFRAVVRAAGFRSMAGGRGEAFCCRPGRSERVSARRVAQIASPSVAGPTDQAQAAEPRGGMPGRAETFGLDGRLAEARAGLTGRAGQSPSGPD